jgi:hypothetical protein
MVYSNLANNTFNYLIETDDTLKVHIPPFRISSTSATAKSARTN